MRSASLKGPIGIFLIAMLMAGHFYTAMIPEVFPQDPVGLTVTPSEQSTLAGGTVRYTVQVSPEPGSDPEFYPTITLVVSPPVSGTTVTFSQNNLKPPFTSTMTVQTSPSMSVGSFTLNIMAHGARVSVRLYVFHMITPPPTEPPTEPPPTEPPTAPPPAPQPPTAPPFDFVLRIMPSSITVGQGGRANYMVYVSYSDPSYMGTVINIQVAGLGQGMTYQSTAAGGLVISTSTTTPPGTYPFVATGSARGVVRQVRATIIVTEGPAPPSPNVTAPPPEELPDLMVDRIQFVPEIIHVGVEAYTEAVIKNIGNASARNVEVLFRAKDWSWELPLITIRYIEAGGEGIARTTPGAVDEPLEVLVVAQVDPNNLIEELNEDNNDKTKLQVVEEAELEEITPENNIVTEAGVDALSDISSNGTSPPVESDSVNTTSLLTPSDIAHALVSLLGPNHISALPPLFAGLAVVLAVVLVLNRRARDRVPKRHPIRKVQPTSKADKADPDKSAYVGDALSEQQDKVSNEAYLSTARKKVLLARHSQLMDYPSHTPSDNNKEIKPNSGETKGIIRKKLKIGDKDECSIPPEGGYKGFEHSLYRSDVHKDKSDSNSKFKWSKYCKNCRAPLYPGDIFCSTCGKSIKSTYDYAAKDYDSFRNTMIDATKDRVPGWEPKNEADHQQDKGQTTTKKRRYEKSKRKTEEKSNAEPKRNKEDD